MGIAVENIGSIMGKTANTTDVNLFNFGGSYTKFYFLIRMGSYRPGDFIEATGDSDRDEDYGTGWRAYLKPYTTFNSLADGGGSRRYGGYPEVGGTGPSTTGISHPYVADIYAIVKPDRVVNEYIQVNSAQNVVTAQTYFKNAIDTILP